MNSVCRCCCNFNRCNNKNGLSCRGRKKKKLHPRKHSPRRRPKRCHKLPHLRFGTKICSKVPEGKIGSVCKFSCLAGYELIGHSVSKCVYNAKTHTAYFVNEPPRCRKVFEVNTECPDQGSIQYGNISCTAGNTKLSTCSFHCVEEGYELFPPGLNHNVCYDDLTWSTPVPCCIRQCPARAVMNMVIMMDSSSSIGEKNWNIMKDFVYDLINDFTFGRDAVLGSIFRFNSEVDTTSQIFITSPEDKINLRGSFDKIPYNGRGTMTAQALQHAKKQIDKLEEMHDESVNVSNVLLVITDGKSQDDVKAITKQLHSQGVASFAVAIKAPHGAPLNETQLLEITRNPQHLLHLNDGFDGLDEEFSLALREAICAEKCTTIFRENI
ncbi:collagen alpha-1(XII) chain-like isoform X2 [Clavelina lepadiformis]